MYKKPSTTIFHISTNPINKKTVFIYLFLLRYQFKNESCGNFSAQNYHRAFINIFLIHAFPEMRLGKKLLNDTFPFTDMCTLCGVI